MKDWLPAVAADLIGVAAFGLVFAGVYLVAGLGWALLSIGVPFAVLYVWNELRTPPPPSEEEEE
jgi:hypothetical protein